MEQHLKIVHGIGNSRMPREMNLVKMKLLFMVMKHSFPEHFHLQ